MALDPLPLPSMAPTSAPTPAPGPQGTVRARGHPSEQGQMQQGTGETAGLEATAVLTAELVKKNSFPGSVKLHFGGKSFQQSQKLKPLHLQSSKTLFSGQLTHGKELLL